jgi:hypothetical protein
MMSLALFLRHAERARNASNIAATGKNRNRHFAGFVSGFEGFPARAKGLNISSVAVYAYGSWAL